MAETLTATVTESLEWKHQGEQGLVTLKLNGSSLRNQSYVDGNGSLAGQINEIYQNEVEIAANSSLTLDLAGGSLGEIRTTVDFTKIKEIMVELPDLGNDTQAGNITVGGAANNTWTGPFNDTSDKIRLPKGGRFRYSLPTVAGLAVTAGSADQLTISNVDLSSAATVRIVLLGIHS